MTGACSGNLDRYTWLTGAICMNDQQTDENEFSLCCVKQVSSTSNTYNLCIKANQ